MSLSKRDAAVSLKSFGRRYAEVAAGPLDDESWERIMRTPASNKRSALNTLQQATADLRALTEVVAILPTTERPSVSLAISANSTATVAESIGNVKAASAAASAAVQEQSNESYDREVNLDGQVITVRQLVTTVVNRCVQGLREAQNAIDSAT